MNADTAAAIGSICAAIVSVAVVIGQVLLSRRIGEVHSLVNGQSHTLNRLTASEAYQRGAASTGAAGAPANTRTVQHDAPASITEPHH